MFSDKTEKFYPSLLILHQENSSYTFIETFDYRKLSNYIILIIDPFLRIYFRSYFVPRSLDGYTKITNRKYPSPRLRGSFCNGHGTTASVVSPFDRQFINFLPSSRVNNGIYRPISIDPPRPGEPIPIAIWNRLAPGPNRYHGGGTRRGYLSRAITINRPFVNRDSAARESSDPWLSMRMIGCVTKPRSLLCLSDRHGSEL